MNICSLVAEFNPFHNGHSYLIDSFKPSYDAVVAIMSGNFAQRGAPCIYGKFARANAAVANGVDLVIELPVIYALSSAETFALGAVKTLNATNCISTLFFGSEIGNIDVLNKIAAFSVNESDDFKNLLRRLLSEGLSYPKALGEAYASFGFDDSITSSPNNILAIEYIKALMRTKSHITPLTLARRGASHDSHVAFNSTASASHIRHLIESGSTAQSFMPFFDYPSPVFDAMFSDVILYALKSATYNDFLSVFDCTPELASKFVRASCACSVFDVISSVKSKNFTQSRIRRILWNIVIKNTLSPLTNPTYIRVLAQNKRGSEVVAHMKKVSTLPVVQKGSLLKNDSIFQTEAHATDIYNLVRHLPSGEDFRHSPIPFEPKNAL